MQDEIVSRLANALNAQLIEAEARRAERLPHPSSMDLYFQGRAWFNKGTTLEHMTEARGFFARALTLDPGNIEATVGMANVDVTVGGTLLTDDRAAFLSAAETNAIKALSLTPDHAAAHLVLGVVYIYTNRAALGIAECEQALAINRNLANAHGVIGAAKYLMGRAAETEGHILEALRLSPLDITAYLWKFCVGLAKMQLGADAEAVGWLRRSIEANRNHSLAHFALAAALESVREHQTGLQSFRSMRRIDARRKNAIALRFRFSQSFASRRQRLSHAIVRSTTQRRGSTTNPLA
jgi:tetratricopeptide (TPR) repeat protein